MSLYADIKFEMKNGYKAPTLSYEQCGEFCNVALEIVKQYNIKQGNPEGKMSFSINLSGDELAEFAKIYTEEVEYEKIEFLIENDGFNWAESKEMAVCDYYKNGEFQIDDKEIVGYNCDKAQAFMPLYNLYKDWARQDALDGDTDIENNLPIFKRYVQLTLGGKMFFGVQISKIKSVTIELC